MPGVDRVDSAAPGEAQTRLTKPLEYAGLLDSYKNHDLTPVIGREYYGLQIVDLLKAENADALIRDLAVTSTSSLPFRDIVGLAANKYQVSQRGVVFLRDQDVTPIQMRDLMERLTHLAGCV